MTFACASAVSPGHSASRICAQIGRSAAVMARMVSSMLHYSMGTGCRTGNHFGYKQRCRRIPRSLYRAAPRNDGVRLSETLLQPKRRVRRALLPDLAELVFRLLDVGINAARNDMADKRTGGVFDRSAGIAEPRHAWTGVVKLAPGAIDRR